MRNWSIFVVVVFTEGELVVVVAALWKFKFCQYFHSNSQVYELSLARFSHGQLNEQKPSVMFSFNETLTKQVPIQNLINRFPLASILFFTCFSSFQSKVQHTLTSGYLRKFFILIQLLTFGDVQFHTKYLHLRKKYNNYFKQTTVYIIA